jgi:hypothetical protein
MRTLAVFITGVVLTFVLSSVLVYVFMPQGNLTIARALAAPPNDPHWNQMWQDIHRMGLTIVFLINPVVALAVGVFVGLLQKTRVALIAAACLVPDFLEGMFSDPVRLWAKSASGAVLFAFQSGLPFIVAIATALLCRRLLQLNRQPTLPSLEEHS